jgi:methanogenic corrinoid protein MtbC1
MKKLLTPKQVARALYASESSVKRWCDRGMIASQKTAGGHRRIGLGDLLDFVRRSSRTIARPELVGLPASTGRTARILDRAARQLTEALVRGDEEQCRQITFDLYLAEHSFSKICDRVFTQAFATIGQWWVRGQLEIYQERRGWEIALRVLHELRRLVPMPQSGAPLAMGGAVEGDPFLLGTTMAELVLRDARWNAVSLGNNLPFTTLAQAIKKHQPRLFWISCSHIEDLPGFLRGYRQLYEQFGREVAFVVGGRALVDSVLLRIRYAAHCENMQCLESYAEELRKQPGGNHRLTPIGIARRDS